MSAAASNRKKRRPNDFQELIRSCKELAPYNAAHVIKVTGPSDLARWRQAFDRALEQIQPETKPVHVEMSNSSFDDTVARELNRPFSPDEASLRAVIIQSGPNCHLLIAVYDHWFADSPSIRVLLQRVFQFYRADSGDLPPIRVANSGETLSGSISANVRALGHAWRAYRSHRRACRIDLQNVMDFQTGFFSRRFDPGVIDNIRAMARRHDAKVNDVFVAAAAQVVGDYTARKRAASRKRLFHARRDRVGIASAVDLRDENADAAIFGFAVGYYTVVLERPEQIELRELVGIVARETASKKVKEKAAGFSLNMKYARLFWKWKSSPHWRAQLFHKGLPLLAGISNANLSGSWIEAATKPGRDPQLLDYLRVSPVGPILPLVFTLTTIGDRLSLCVSFRTTAFSPTSAQQIGDAFMAKLIAFGWGGDAVAMS